MKALVVGYGSIGKRHIDNLSSFENIRIIVCTKRDPDRFLKNKNCIVHSTLKSCIKENPNFAIICNETSNHIQTAIKLSEAGIHTFIEKPLSNSIKNLKELLEIVEEKKLITHVGAVLRFHPCIKKIKEILLKKELGKILSVYVENGSYLPDWHPTENYQKSYAARKELGGGVVLTCIHEIDYLYWFFGKIREISSHIEKISDLEISAEDFCESLFVFNNKIISQVHLDYYQRPKIRTCKIIGTNGTLICDLEQNSIRVFNIKTKKWNQKLTLKKYDKNIMYLEELRYFINCLKNNSKSFNDAIEGAYVLRVALTIKKSAELKKGIVTNEK